MDERKWLLKEGGGLISASCDISRENMSTSHAGLFKCICSDFAMPLVICLFVRWMQMVSAFLVQCCFFSDSMYNGINWWVYWKASLAISLKKRGVGLFWGDYGNNLSIRFSHLIQTVISVEWVTVSILSDHTWAFLPTPLLYRLKGTICFLAITSLR